MTESGTVPADEVEFDLDRPVPLHDLTFLAEGDDVTVGRASGGSYAVLPADGAALIRRLTEGDTPRAALAWYEATYGEPVDIADMLAALVELEFVRDEGDESAPVRAVRWQRLGRILFGPVAWACYAAVIGWAVVAAVRSPELRPTYHNIFFIDYYSVIQASLFVAAIPLLLAHEGFHALAGRRLGLATSLSISRRLYFIVLETSMDGLVTVPRRQRYLPILAGLLADVLAVAGLTVAADLSRHADGTLSLGGRFCLAVAFAAVLRILWQFSFYLRTDVYALVATVLGCVDLHRTAKEMLAERFRRVTRRPARYDPESWHPRDVRVGRWYQWLVLGGYALSLVTFVLAVGPIALTMITGVAGRLLGITHPTGLQLLDSVVIGTFAVGSGLLYLTLTVRDRRRRRAGTGLRHVIG